MQDTDTDLASDIFPVNHPVEIKQELIARSFRKTWGLMKAASTLTFMNGKKKKVDVGNNRETLANIVRHDYAAIMEGGKAEIIKALVEELLKKLEKKGKTLEL